MLITSPITIRLETCNLPRRKRENQSISSVALHTEHRPERFWEGEEASAVCRSWAGTQEVLGSNPGSRSDLSCFLEKRLLNDIVELRWFNSQSPKFCNFSFCTIYSQFSVCTLFAELPACLCLSAQAGTVRTSFHCSVETKDFKM